MNKGRKQKVINGLEMDVIYGRHYFCYMDNRPGLVRWVKRKMNKRYRQELKEETKKELEEV
jgi:trans-aconitate methyltransferase